MSQSKLGITAVICDLDGLLVDTEPVYDEVFAAYAREKGCLEKRVQEDLPRLRQQMYGKKKEESAWIFFQGLNLTPNIQNQSSPAFQEALHEWLTWREPRLLELFPKARPMPGAQKLIEYLQELNFSHAVATSSDSSLWKAKSHTKPWLQKVPVVLTGDKVARGKPAPDLFLKAAEELGVEAQHCLVFEDALDGVAAAKAAGMRVYAIPHPAIAHHPDFGAADKVLRSLTEFDTKELG